MRAITAYGFSLLFHAGLLAWLGLVLEIPPAALPVEHGRAAIALTATLGVQDEPEIDIDLANTPPPVRRVAQEPLAIRPAAHEPGRTAAEIDYRRPGQQPAAAATAPEVLVLQPREVTLQDNVPSLPHPKPLPMHRVPASPAGASDVALPPLPSSQPETGAEIDQLAGNPSPVYPPQALAAGMEGRVRLRVTVGASGRVEKLRVETTSGVRSLDYSALATVRQWRFKPARRGGVATASEVIVPIRFRIGRE